MLSGRRIGARLLRVATRPGDQILRTIVERGVHDLLRGFRVQMRDDWDAKGEDGGEYVEHY
jgi:hypothetical protein